MSSLDNEPVWVNVDCKTQSGQRYVGDFEVKRFLSIKERREVARDRSEACQGIEVNDPDRPLFDVLAQLNTHVLKSPDWWKDNGWALEEEEPIWQLMVKIRRLQRGEDPDADEAEKKPSEEEKKETAETEESQS